LVSIALNPYYLHRDLEQRRQVQEQQRQAQEQQRQDAERQMRQANEARFRESEQKAAANKALLRFTDLEAAVRRLERLDPEWHPEKRLRHLEQALEMAERLDRDKDLLPLELVEQLGQTRRRLAEQLGQEWGF
jgi:hypothetical protein